MTDGALSLMTSVFQRYLADGCEPPLTWRGGNTGLWRTADGKFLCTTDLERAYWERFCRAVHREDLTPLGHDPQQRDKLDEELGALFLQRTRDEWFDLLRTAGCQAAPAYDLDEALSDPHARARGSIVDVEDPRAGRVTQVGPLIKLSETPGAIRWTARPPGADSREVLAEFGLNESQIEAALSETAAQADAPGAPAGKR